MSGHNKEVGEAGTEITTSTYEDDLVETGNELSPIGIIPNPNLLVPNLAPDYIGPDYFIIKMYHGGFLQDGLLCRNIWGCRYTITNWRDFIQHCGRAQNLQKEKLE